MLLTLQQTLEVNLHDTNGKKYQGKSPLNVSAQISVSLLYDCKKILRHQHVYNLLVWHAMDLFF